MKLKYNLIFFSFSDKEERFFFKKKINVLFLLIIFQSMKE